MKFGEKLKNARLQAELTQQTVAKRIGVSRQSLSNWENDRTYPDLASVLKLSDLYGLSLDDLLRHDMELRRRMEKKRETRKDGGKQTGIYRVPYQDGEFVLVVNFVK